MKCGSLLEPIFKENTRKIIYDSMQLCICSEIIFTIFVSANRMMTAEVCKFTPEYSFICLMLLFICLMLCFVCCFCFSCSTSPATRKTKTMDGARHQADE
jgi:hypothetical protein